MVSSETGSKLSIIRIVQVLLRESDKDHPCLSRTFFVLWRASMVWS